MSEQRLSKYTALAVLASILLVACTATSTRLVYLTSASDGLVGCDTDAGVDAGVDASADATDAADGANEAAEAEAEAEADAGSLEAGSILECAQAAGTWANVTPASVTMNPNLPANENAGDPGGNYGAQDILADPVNPNVLYAFICHQGVWRSADYGCTWTKVSTGANAAHLLTGRPWTAAIDPNVARDPSTAPALYTANGDGDQLGVYVSVNGGVDWANYGVGNTTARYGGADDAYAFDIDPGNSQHLITGMHDEGLSESLNGGQTWRTVKVPSAFGLSVYPFFVRTGNAATTSTTWITIAQWDSNTQGMWRTTDSGTTWTQVNRALEHDHGSAQLYQNGSGLIIAAGEVPGAVPIERSTDFGVTWHSVTDGSTPQSGIFGTAAWLYATRPFADNGGIAQHFQRATIASAGVTWTDWAPTSPATNGAKRAAVTSDGTHAIIVSGNWNAGIWRYVEPLGDGG